MSSDTPTNACAVNLAWIAAHRRHHGIDDHPVLDRFATLAGRLPGVTAECSCKLAGDRVHAGRFHLLSVVTSGHDERLGAALDLLDALDGLDGVTLDRSLFHRYHDDWFSMRHVASLFCGIDLREDLAASRVKIWFGVYGSPELLDRALALHRSPPALRALVRGRLLVGFDFGFDGTTAIKVYPDFRREEIDGDPDLRDHLAAALSPATLALTDACHWVHVSWSHAQHSAVVHLHPAEPDAFVDRLDSPLAREVHAPYRGVPMRNVCVSVLDTEIAAGAPTHLNLYWKR